MSRPTYPQQSTSTILVGLNSVPTPTVVVTQDNRNHHHHQHQYPVALQPQQIIVPTSNPHNYTTYHTHAPVHYNSPLRNHSRRDPREDCHNSHTHNHSYHPHR
ncbi:Uncharacterised protein [Legionella busanensis]|uniref:Uncharacterized protein n=1 Tax=Legionella busanensis TaxID=190655 RepID=A0A378JH75_9GAMM|nr:hypothetical protein [Legionella busanensis]STX50048.1 Uncharacterised protein [Legionella busanensis]